MKTRRSWKLVVGVVAFLLAASFVAPSASAFTGQYPEYYRALWRPTAGSVTTSFTTDPFAWPRSVDQNFKWTTWVSLARLDTPRTPSHRGTYEHQLTFDGGWCDESAIQATFLDLPTDSYHDTVGIDEGEISYGMQAWRLVEDHNYDITFECLKEWDATNNDYKIQGQIGHCPSGPCTSLSTWSDETTSLMPTIKGDAPDTHSYDDVFSNNRSFESSTSPWTVNGGTVTRYCGGTPYHRDCYLRVVDSSGGSGATLRFDFAPSPATASTAAVINESAVRCGTSNSVDCKMQWGVSSYDSGGNFIETQWGNTLTIPVGGGWYLGGTHTQGFNAGTPREWRFKIRSTNNSNFHIDYAVNTWHNPR